MKNWGPLPKNGSLIKPVPLTIAERGRGGGGGIPGEGGNVPGSPSIAEYTSMLRRTSGYWSHIELLM